MIVVARVSQGHNGEFEIDQCLEKYPGHGKENGTNHSHQPDSSRNLGTEQPLRRLFAFGLGVNDQITLVGLLLKGLGCRQDRIVGIGVVMVKSLVGEQSRENNGS